MDDPNLAILYWAPMWLLGVIFLISLLLATECGHRMAACSRVRQDSQAGAHLGTVLAAVMGLLSLLLAFTYSFAATRADNRKQAVIAEANAIGTAYLRAGLVPDPTRSRLRVLLRDYADTRLVTGNILSTPSQWQMAIADTERIQSKLWPTAVRGMEGRSPTIIDSLLFQALNAVIDLHTIRLAAGRDRLPEVMPFMLFSIAVVVMCMMGYSTGLAGHRHPVMTTTLAVLYTVVTLVIIDLDRPRTGLVHVSQQSLIDVRRSMQADAPPAPAMPAPLHP